MHPLNHLRQQGREAIARRQASMLEFRSRFWAMDGAGQPAWWSWARTFIWSAVAAVTIAYFSRVLVVAAPRDLLDQAALNAAFLPALCICLCVGLVMQAIHSVAQPWLGGRQALAQRPLRWQARYRTAVSALGMLIGWPLGWALAHGEWPHWLQRDAAAENLWVLLVASASLSGLFDWVFTARLRLAQSEQQATEARLRLLQGQIEPHFLFNTLANVHSLIDQDAPQAKRMLESFTDYLRSSTVQLRSGDGTVGEELDLVSAYLELQQIRLGDRLRVRIDCDDGTRPLSLPPLLLQPLVENAVRHGIEPQVDGGELTVQVRATAGQLQLSVRDTGVGLQAAKARPRPSAGTGLALANLRGRLQTRYGKTASLTLSDTPTGTLALLCLPLPTAHH